MDGYLKLELPIVIKCLTSKIQFWFKISQIWDIARSHILQSLYVPTDILNLSFYKSKWHCWYRWWCQKWEVFKQPRFYHDVKANCRRSWGVLAIMFNISQHNQLLNPDQCCRAVLSTIRTISCPTSIFLDYRIKIRDSGQVNKRAAQCDSCTMWPYLNNQEEREN